MLHSFERVIPETDSGLSRDAERLALARVGAAFAVGARWILLPSVIASGVAIWCLGVWSPATQVARGALIATGMAGVFQLYLALRIEFDRVVFQYFAADPAEHAVSAFDRAMITLGVMRSGRAGRPMRERVRGLLRLVKFSAFVFVLQIALLVVAYST